MVIDTGTGRFKGSVTVDGAEKVPSSFPAQLTENVIGALGPEVRVNVIVRSSLSPTSHPSRSYRPSPSFGVANRWL